MSSIKSSLCAITAAQPVGNETNKILSSLPDFQYRISCDQLLAENYELRLKKNKLKAKLSCIQVIGNQQT